MPQSLSHVVVHCVFSTKGRTPWLKKEIREELHPYVVGVLRNHKNTPIQVGGVEDHVHLLLGQSRTMSMAQIVEKVKTSSNDFLKRKWPHLQDFAWQAGYGVGSVSPEELDRLVAYIRNQEEHHKKLSYQEEYRAFLNEIGVEYDERYMWD